MGGGGGGGGGLEVFGSPTGCILILIGCRT